MDELAMLVGPGIVAPHLALTRPVLLRSTGALASAMAPRVDRAAASSSVWGLVWHEDPSPFAMATAPRREGHTHPMLLRRDTDMS